MYKSCGYVVFSVKGKPVKRANLVAERKIGRKLRKGECAHHLNGIRDDDRPENIEVMLLSEHARLSGKKNIEDLRKKTGTGKRISWAKDPEISCLRCKGLGLIKKNHVWPNCPVCNGTGLKEGK